MSSTRQTNVLKKLLVLSLAVAAAAPLCAMEGGGGGGAGAVVAAPEGAADAKERNLALIAAARDGNLAQVQALLDAGANVNAVDEFGKTPLHGAAARGHVEVVRALRAAAGANVNARDDFGRTPLHEAAERGHVEVVRALW